jgi:hypothetical protein
MYVYRYIDRLRRVRAGTTEQVEEWKKRKEAKLREWIDGRGNPDVCFPNLIPIAC